MPVCLTQALYVHPDAFGGNWLELSPAPRIQLATDREQRFEPDIPATAIASAIAVALR